MTTSGKSFSKRLGPFRIHVRCSELKRVGLFDVPPLSNGMPFSKTEAEYAGSWSCGNDYVDIIRNQAHSDGTFGVVTGVVYESCMLCGLTPHVFVASLYTTHSAGSVPGNRTP